jgi:rhodanese-related sulfurtransferase
MTPETTPQQVPDDAVILDVREQDEWDAGHAPTAVHIPLTELPARLGELPSTDGTLPIVCRGGGRSARATQWLAAQGYDVVNIDGGMKAWVQAGKPLESAGGAQPEVI